MIYITNRYDSLCETSYINNVWDCKQNNVEELYKEFMYKKADAIGIIVNPHWLNMMNHKDHHPQLSTEVYKMREKEWKRILRQWNIDKFIGDVLRGKKLEYKQII